MKIKGIEPKYLLATIFVVLAVILCYLQTANWVAGDSDSAFFTEITESVATRGLPLSKLQASTHEAVQYWNKTSEEICASPLAPSDISEENQFDKHTYYIIYAIAPLTYLIKAEVLLPSLTTLGFMVLLLVAYLFLRNKNVPMFPAVLFCVLISAHPAWSISMFGQLYSDRLFMPLAAVYLYFVLGRNRNYWAIFLWGILCASVVERAGFMIGIFTLAYSILGYELDKKDRKYLAGIGIAFIVISLFMVIFLIDNARYGSQSGGAILAITNILSGNIDEKLKVFMYFNLLLAMFLLTRPRLFLVAMLMLAPNALGSIGGAEKTGWLTHYHSLYFPFLAMLSAMGFSDVYAYFKAKSRQLAVYATLVIVIMVAAISDPYRFLQYDVSNLDNNAFVKSYYSLADYLILGNQAHLAYLSTKESRLRGYVPEGSKVTTSGLNMPTLYKGRTIYYYPVGIDSADYAVLQMAEDSKGERYYKGAISYKGIDEAQKIDKCLTGRLEASGYDTSLPVIINDSVILTRNEGKVDFGEEILINPLFTEQYAGWSMYGDVRRQDDSGIKININNILSQKIEVLPNQLYRYALNVSCIDSDADFRMQVNWHDKKNKFITSDILLLSCTDISKEHAVKMVAPAEASRAYFYVSGSDEKSVLVAGASFRKSLM